MVAYAPVHDASGKVLGAVVLGNPLNDERLKRTSELTSGRPLGLFASGHESPIAVAGAAGAQAALQSSSAKAVSKSATGGNLSFSPAATAGEIVAALKLSGYGSREAVLVASIPATRVQSVAGLLWPVFAVAALGLLLVVAGGVMLGNYISRPVAEIEEGLLLIINGQQDLRFDLEHEELGGLTSRINALLNTLLGVAEGESSTDNR